MTYGDLVLESNNDACFGLSCVLSAVAAPLDLSPGRLLCCRDDMSIKPATRRQPSEERKVVG